MEQEEFEKINLSVLEDETLKYIYITLMKSKNIKKTKKELAQELNISVKAITSKFARAAYMVNTKKDEDKEKLDIYVRKCIKNDLIQLSEIAEYYSLEEDDLKAAFTNYISSFTDEESEIADRFPWSEEAIKKGNIQTLIYRVNGFSKYPKNSEQVFYRFVNEQDIQFLKSVKDIYSEYRVDDVIKVKVK